MEIRELRYFLAVAREENITRAAETLHITQPSLSKQLMELEKKLGKQLLIRGKRKVTLTQEGILLRKRAEEIIDLVEKTEKEISRDLDDVVGEIHIGGNASESILYAAAKVREHYPGIRFNFYSGDAIDVTERLDHGSLDFAVMLQPVDQIKYDFLSLTDCSEWGILVKSGTALSHKKAVTKEDIQTLPLIMHQRAGLQSEIAHWADTDAENLNIVATYNVVHGSPIPFVEQDLGCFLTTREMLSPTLPPTVCFLPLKPRLSTHLAFVWKKHSVFSKAADAFLTALLSHLQTE